MNALLTILSIALGLSVAFTISPDGPAAVLLCMVLATAAGVVITRQGEDGQFLLRVFVCALLVRVMLGTVIYSLTLQEFFGGDAKTYDEVGLLLLRSWQGELDYMTSKGILGPFIERNWGMPYLVAVIYSVIGRNMLAVQYVNAVMGAATAPIIFLCARHIFRNLRVARLSAYFVAFYPSLVLWSSQGLKDGPIVFLLALVMLATLKLGEKLSLNYLFLLALSLFGLLSLRFYIFYMAVAAIGGAFLIGMRRQTTRTLFRQVVVVAGVGLTLTYLGVLRTASYQLDTFADLERIQLSRADLAGSAQSGFGHDVDVSTSSGALSVIPVGMVYLLFAPFPWQVANLRQSITLPEMLVWWASFPLLVLGAYFTVKYRLRQALPILIFTSMLTLAYSIFQGNVGTAYRQRSQILIFYFIFVAVGYVLLKERREDQTRKRERASEEARAVSRARMAARKSARAGSDAAAAFDLGAGESREDGVALPRAASPN